jgi:tRNA synthetases class I (M)
MHLLCKSIHDRVFPVHLCQDGCFVRISNLTRKRHKQHSDCKRFAICQQCPSSGQYCEWALSSQQMCTRASVDYATDLRCMYAGTDDHGTATEATALEVEVTPQELCDKYHELHAKIYDEFKISFDYFDRTITDEQGFAPHMFMKLQENGHSKEQITTQPFCENNSSLLADRFVEGQCPNCGYADARGDQCKIDGASPVPREITHIHLCCTCWDQHSSSGHRKLVGRGSGHQPAGRSQQHS